ACRKEGPPPNALRGIGGPSLHSGGDARRVLLRLLVRGVLRTRPEEAAQAVALRPGYDMGVQVRDRLRDLVVDRDERAAGAQSRPRPRGKAAAKTRNILKKKSQVGRPASRDGPGAPPACGP